ncbi:hypothetical protein GPL21_17345 [Bradyrhizobium pachyrhizi]|uniref:Uncharacterized protein n=1 Tax=Bradyrhizobium pachyrhizi TaxID=280333 RepID=A0A844SLP5_9BRAD|nr:hypothetical protein [Bradyrhizobium pachyrhizi]MVT66867.1 hypothetical protein [Bradyrhizobium pachyrhizi]
MGIALGGSLFWGAFGPVATDKNFDRLATSVPEAPPHPTKEDNEEALVRYTLWLAVLTGGLVFVSAGQGFFLLRADKTARITAEAAQAQTHNFSKLERPYLYVSDPRGLLESNTPDSFHYVTYQVANYGKTPATIEAVYTAITVEKVPGNLAHTQRWHSLMQRPIMIPNETRPDLRLAVPDSIAIGEYADEDTAPMPIPELAGDEEFYVRILIKYRGPFTSDHETSACWRWEGTSLAVFDDVRFTYMR